MTPPGTPATDVANRAYQGAWTAIAAASGSYRAGWIVLQTHPTNWDDTTKPPLALPLLFPIPSRPLSRASPAQMSSPTASSSSAPSATRNFLKSSVRLSPTTSPSRPILRRANLGLRATQMANSPSPTPSGGWSTSTQP